MPPSALQENPLHALCSQIRRSTNLHGSQRSHMFDAPPILLSIGKDAACSLLRVAYSIYMITSDPPPPLQGKRGWVLSISRQRFSMEPHIGATPHTPHTYQRGRPHDFSPKIHTPLPWNAPPPPLQEKSYMVSIGRPTVLHGAQFHR